MRHASRPGHRALRRGRWSQRGQVYLVTSATSKRERVFVDFESRCAASAAFHDFDREGDARLLAWVLMPEHAHWLLQLDGTESLAQAVNRLKSSASRRVNCSLQRSGTLWTRGFHDRALRQDDDLIAAARYVVANPVRAGLASRVGDYPFWNAVYL